MVSAGVTQRYEYFAPNEAVAGSIPAACFKDDLLEKLDSLPTICGENGKVFWYYELDYGVYASYEDTTDVLWDTMCDVGAEVDKVLPEGWERGPSDADNDSTWFEIRRKVS